MTDEPNIDGMIAEAATVVRKVWSGESRNVIAKLIGVGVMIGALWERQIGYEFAGTELDEFATHVEQRITTDA
jgi:hypothetical protein